MRIKMGDSQAPPLGAEESDFVRWDCAPPHEITKKDPLHLFAEALPVSTPYARSARYSTVVIGRHCSRYSRPCW